MKKYLTYALTVLVGLSIFTGCTSSDDSSSTPTTNSVVQGVLVDPFIKGAVLCEDLNKDAQCQSSEQTSTTTDSNGKFGFSNPLSVGSHIIMKQQGFHNDVPYTLSLAGVVDADAKIDVISPLTTLQTKDLTNSQIRGLLTNAGLENLSDDDIFANPLEGGINSLNTNDKLVRLHATLATYGMLKVMKGSKRLSELSSTQFINSSQVNQILTAMVSTIKSTLSKENLDSFQTTANSFNQTGFTAPPVSANVVIKTAVTTIDALTKIAYDTCNQTDGTDTQKVTAALAQMNARKTSIINKISQIGMQYYAKENKAIFEKVPAQYRNNFPDNIKIGLAINDEEAIIISQDETIASQSTNVSNFIITAYADPTTKAQATLITNCPTDAINEDEPHYAAGLDCDKDGGKVAFETPRGFKVAFKSMGLINSNDEKVYLFNKATLTDSIVFDITDPKALGEITIPQGNYKSAFAQVYYYWLDMQMYNEGNYTQFRVYMSDDNTTHATQGHHQGDITITDINNTELGWLDPSKRWIANDAIHTRLEPIAPQTKMYAASPDPDTSRQRGPFGGDSLWNDETLNPNDIFTLTQNINLNITKESKIQLTFNVKNNWYFEDYNGDGIFGAGVHKHKDNNITEAADTNASWAPLLELPSITTLY